MPAEPGPAMSLPSSPLKSSDLPSQTAGLVQSSRAVLDGPASSNMHRQPQAPQASLVREVQTHAVQGGLLIEYAKTSNAANVIASAQSL